MRTQGDEVEEMRTQGDEVKIKQGDVARRRGGEMEQGRRVAN